MFSSSPQSHDKESPSARVRTVSPATGTFFNWAPAEKAIHWPSGEKQELGATLSVPEMSLASNSSSERSEIPDVPAWAMRKPSRERVGSGLPSGADGNEK